MANEPGEAAPAEQSNANASAGGRNRRVMIGGVLAGVMLLEGVGLYLAMKMFGAGPEEASADEGLVDQGGQPKCERLEIIIAKLKVPNGRAGRTYLYDVQVAATVTVPDGKLPEDYKGEVEEMIAARENAIQDRLSVLIRRSEPQALDEPGLVMIRRQIQAELGKVFGDEKLFSTILLPRWTPLRADM